MTPRQTTHLRTSPARSSRALAALALLALTAPAPAQTQNGATPPTPAAAAPKTTDKPAAQTIARPETPAQRARHEVCMAFVRRHNLNCDPWTQPTCGYDSGYARPLECVAP